jgi:flagellar hook-associated protein 1 FlgK
MAISPAFSIAQRALMANESALGVVGNNIANVNTPGFTRQVPQFVADVAVPQDGVLIGTGTHIQTVLQVLDPLLERRLLGSQTDLAQQNALKDQLGSLAGLVNDLDTPSVASALGGFFDAADALARNPSGLAERQTLLGSATTLAADLNQRHADVAALQRAADDRFVSVATGANASLQKIATLNTAIVAAETGSQQANELRDQRRQALNDLSSALGIATVDHPDGSITVQARNGLVLVDAGSVVNPIAVSASGTGIDGAPLHQAGIPDPAGGGVIAVPGAFDSGELGGLAQARDQDIPNAATALDTFALALRDQVNAIQTDPAALDLDGNSTAAVPLFGGTGAGDLSVLVSDPRQIGAALSAQPGDNQNALRLADLRTAPVAALAGASFSGFLASQQGQVGEAAAGAEDAAAARDALNQQLANQRASLSGVNLNEELTNLIKFQRAFQAASRVITAVDATLQDLLNSVS